jgi:hypothetical protein
VAFHNKAMAPEICGVAMDVPLKVPYEVSLALRDDRVLVPGAQISGLIRPLPSAVTGPRLLKPAMLSVPVVSAPIEYVAS